MRSMTILRRALSLFAVGAGLTALVIPLDTWTTPAAGEGARRAAPVGGYAPLAQDRGKKQFDLRNPWRTLQTDGYHDPDSDAVNRLQQPKEALRSLPRAFDGNFVDWVKALKIRSIEPRAEVDKPGQMKIDPLVSPLRNTGPMPIVNFPHAAHTEWLACSNCHDELFPKKRGATKIRMVEIFQGKACGVCHGTVAFPPSQCARCHNGPKRSARN